MNLSRRATIATLLATSAAVPLAARALTQAGEKPRAGDYMPAALRDRVEALKRDVAARPSGDADYKDRSLTLYDWANAYSLTGKPIHGDLTAAMAQMQSPGFPRQGDRARQTAFANLDALVRTLAALEADPAIMGVLTTTNRGPFEADGYATFDQTYKVGSAPIRAGGGFVCPNHFYFRLGEYQAADPKADNYMTIRSSNPGVTFAVDTQDLTGMFSIRLGGAPAPRLFFRVASGELKPGDTVTVTFGDRSGGSKGVKLVPWSNSALRFPIWVLTEPGGLMLAPREIAFPIVGAKAAGVRGFAPSIVASGEAFEISVRTEDFARNRATGGAPAWRLMLDGKVVRRIARSANAITVVSGLKLGTVGVHRFTLVSEDGRMEGEVNPILVEANPTERIAWGETHGHCGFSEGMGLLDDYFAFARDESRLDFVCLSEHDLWMDAGEWEQMRGAVKTHDRPGRFTTFLGYEWTVDAPLGGHHNVLFRNADGVHPVSRVRHPTLPDLYRGLKKAVKPKDVIVIPHAHTPGDWTISDSDLEPLVEIVSEHGTFEWLGQRYLAQGHMVGFIGASDNHIGHPGYKTRPKGAGYTFEGWGGLAAVSVPRHDRDVIFDALRDRRTYATNQVRIILKTVMNGGRMGVVAPSAARREVAGVVHGTGPIESITLVKNGEDHETASFDGTVDAKGPVLVEVRFHSTSFVAAKTPSRTARIWEGTIEVEGAKLVGVSSPQAEALNTLTEWVKLDPLKAGRAQFRLGTRGHAKVVRLTLDGPLDKVRLTLDLPGGTIPTRVTAPVPAADDTPLVLKLHYKDPGTARRGIGEFDDAVTVRRIAPATERDRTFRFVDELEPKDGDYYYIRVVQADGGMAWSSPVWVGSLPNKGKG